MKNLRSRQRGMTMWGMIFVGAVIACTVYISFLLIPNYLNYLKVKGALDSLSRQADAGAMSRGEISEAIGKRFDIDTVTFINLGEDLSVETRGRAKVARIRYEVVEPIIGNVSLLMQFDYSVQLSGGGGG